MGLPLGDGFALGSSTASVGGYDQTGKVTHCVKYQNFTQFPSAEILWKRIVSAESQWKGSHLENSNNKNVYFVYSAEQLLNKGLK